MPKALFLGRGDDLRHAARYQKALFHPTACAYVTFVTTFTSPCVVGPGTCLLEFQVGYSAN